MNLIMFDLTGKIALITGASRGIGKSISMILAQNGAHVICISRNINDVQSVVDDIINQKFNASAASCDISSTDNVTSLVKSIIDEHGKIDILVNNAGINRDNLLMRMSEDDWDKVLNVNLKAVFTSIKVASRSMIKQRSGRIINISSVVGLTGNSGQVNYAASKAGLIGMTKSIAKEFASRGITANCIAPGYIETEMTSNLTDDVKSSIKEQIPLGRIGCVEDIAHAVAYLASDEASYITGQTLTVDGGMVM